MKWTSKSLGSRVQHDFFYVLVHLRLIFLARFILYFVALYYSLAPSVRKRSSYYLQRRFPHSTPFGMWLHCYKVYIHFANILLDRIVFAIQGSFHISFTEKSREILMDTIQKKEGCIILSAHVGAWQLGLLDIENIQRPINIVQLRNPEDNDKHYFEHRKQENKHPIKIISSLQGMQTSLEIVSALKNNELVCMMGDRLIHEAEPVMEMPFLHGKIALPLTPFIMASITQCPLLVTFSVRENKQIRGVWAERLEIPEGMRKHPEKLHPYVQRFVIGLESMVEKYPYQFFNFYDMWIENNDK